MNQAWPVIIAHPPNMAAGLGWTCGPHWSKRLHTIILDETTRKNKLFFSWNYLLWRWNFWVLPCKKGFPETEANAKKVRAKLLIVWNQVRWHHLISWIQQSLKLYPSLAILVTYARQTDCINGPNSCICPLGSALTIWPRVLLHDLLWPISR